MNQKKKDALWSALRERLQDLRVRDREVLLNFRLTAFTLTTGALATAVLDVLESFEARKKKGGR